MIVQSVAIGFDCIPVVLNIASICLDVCVIFVNLSILCVLLTLDGCKTLSHFRIQLAICIFTFRSFLIDVLLQSCIGILTVTNFLRDICSIGCNISFITSNASFMIVQSVAIGFDCIPVVLNIASICLDVCVIFVNLSILCVLLTLDGCKTLSHFRIQLAICIFTFSSFIGIGLIQSCESSRHILVDGVESIRHILVDLFDNFILCFIGTDTGCRFFGQGAVQVGYILANGIASFSNSTILYRCIGLADVIGCCLFFQIFFYVGNPGIYAGNPGIQLRVSFLPSCHFISNSCRISSDIFGVIFCSRLCTFQ